MAQGQDQLPPFIAAGTFRWQAIRHAYEQADDRELAAVLATADLMDRAILTRDAKEFSAVFADDAVVNYPFNRKGTLWNDESLDRRKR